MSKVKTALSLLTKNRKQFFPTLTLKFSQTKAARLLSDKAFAKKTYKACFGKKLNLKDPKTFNEKLQWLKLYDHDPSYPALVDKDGVKAYVAERIGEEHIIPTLGIYDSFDEIDFDALPEQFVLKCTHDSGSIVICRDKSKLDKRAARKKLEKKRKRSFFWVAREWPYKKIKGRIIAEKYMQDDSHPDLKDYKFYCFGGEPKFLYLSHGLSNHATGRISFVDFNWERMPFHRSDFAEFDELPPKPANLALMLEFAKKLSAGIPFLRVDFYDINGKLYFGELTFYPGAGLTPLKPDEWERTLGDWIELPKK